MGLENEFSAEDESHARDREELLRLLLERRSAETTISRCAREERDGVVRVPLSLAQQRLWFIDRLESGRAPYVISETARLRGDLNVTALQQALNDLVSRHESLRTVFIVQGTEPAQEIAKTRHFELHSHDLSGYEEEERAQTTQRHRIEEVETRFDLQRGPLIRGRLLRLADQDHLLLVCMHHIISDGWSIRVFFRELALLYSTHCGSKVAPLAPLPIQYADYAQWQRTWWEGAPHDTQMGYWRERLMRGVQPLQLPTDRPRPSSRSFRGETIPIHLSAVLTREIKSCAQRYGLTLFMVLYAAWAVYLSRLCAQEDVVIGTPVANRRRPELEGLIGFFVNTLVLRLRVSPESSLEQFFAQVREVTLGAYDHQDAPFAQIVEAIQPERSLGRNPLFDVMFAVQNVPGDGVSLPGLSLTYEGEVLRTAPFDVLLLLEENSDAISGYLNYASDLFDRATALRWASGFTTLLQDLTTGAATRIGDMSILPDDERELVVRKFNATYVSWPGMTTVPGLVDLQAHRSPQAVAARCSGSTLTYGALRRWSNQLARALRARGVPAGARVAIYCRRSVEMIVGMLAVLKAQACYVPLDPGYPRERLTHLFNDSAPSFLLTQQSLLGELPASMERTLSLDALGSEVIEESEADLESQEGGVELGYPAYVIYTSGSTGAPKGVVVSQRNLLNLIRWHCTAFGVREGSRCSSLAALGFDAAVWEIWPALCAGGTLHLAPPDLAGDVPALLDWWSKQPLQISFLPTPLAELAFSQGITNVALRTLLVGGDRLRQYPKTMNFTLINNYGPTEATVVATSGQLQGDHEELHIGRPIANTQVYVLDSSLQPVPIGTSGELYVGGAGVALGYLNRPDLTAAAFIPDPFAADAGARLYRTGDVGRWRGDGTIEFLGRNDHQVKIRGYRIELGEIEAQLLKHPCVEEAVVVVHADASAAPFLVAYVTTSVNSSFDVEQMRAFLALSLPDQMIPALCVMLDHLPLTAHGKLDRNALPAPGREAYVARVYEPPQGESESRLARLWQELLGVDRIGRGDNFFALGGHSLQAARLVARLAAESAIDLSVVEVFRHPTLLAMAEAVDSAPSVSGLAMTREQGVL